MESYSIHFCVSVAMWLKFSQCDRREIHWVRLPGKFINNPQTHWHLIRPFILCPTPWFLPIISEMVWLLGVQRLSSSCGWKPKLNCNKKIEETRSLWCFCSLYKQQTAYFHNFCVFLLIYVSVCQLFDYHH